MCQEKHWKSQHHCLALRRHHTGVPVITPSREVLRHKDHASNCPAKSSAPYKPEHAGGPFLPVPHPGKVSTQRVYLVNYIILVSVRAEGLLGVQKKEVLHPAQPWAPLGFAIFLLSAPVPP